MGFLFKCMPLDDFKNLTEIVSQRSYTRKVYDIGDGKLRYRFHTAHKHYKDTNGLFQEIDTTLAQDIVTKQWKHNKASYHPSIPEYSDGWFEFYNAFDGVKHTIKA